MAGAQIRRLRQNQRRRQIAALDQLLDRKSVV
jgi:hypothetical protein